MIAISVTTIPILIAMSNISNAVIKITSFLPFFIDNEQEKDYSFYMGEVTTLPLES